MLGCFGEATQALLSTEIGRHKLDLAYRSRSLWADWLDALGDDSGTRPDDILTADGTVVMLNTVGLPGVDDVNYDAVLRSLDAYAEPYETLVAGAIDWLDPDPLSRPLRAVRIPGERAVDSGALLDALHRAFLHLGGVEVTDQAVRLDRAGPRVRGVSTSTGERLTAPRVVLAAGARTQDLLDTVPDVAARIPRMVSGVGISAVLHDEGLPAPTEVLRTPNRAFACGLHLVPRRPGEVYVGATNIIEPTPADTPVVREVLFLLTCATRQLRKDLWKAGLHRIQVGNRPVAVDGYPLLGETDLAGLWLMTGTYRDGLHLSPLLAREFAAQLAGRPAEVDLDPFRPVRAPLQPTGRDEIVEMAVTHMLATGFEYDWHIPVEWPHMISNHLRLAFARFADDLDEQYTPPPEILAKARVSPPLVKLLRDFYEASRAAAVLEPAR
jgi:glycine/D-amino acid oxidase-like deaminating enzyme